MHNRLRTATYRFSVTISIGISFYPYDGERIDALISQADEAL
ncbi:MULTISPECIES: diguanylate cyclase domain-containing protein [Legionella]|nr:MULTISPECIES: diguanylate cyclase [Legionella]MBN9226393.1 diguanylate cyclase [Legionella steelei]